MTTEEIRHLRARLGLNQAQLASVLGVHWVTVSKWERGFLAPDPYREALLMRFKEGADRRDLGNTVVAALVGAGAVAALFLLLQAAFEER